MTAPGASPTVVTASGERVSNEGNNWLALGSYDDLVRRGCLTGQGIVAFHHEGKVYAVDNRCPHMGFPLSEGTVHGGILTCHWHSWQFDLESGGCLTPAESDVAVYATKIDGGQVYVARRVDPRGVVIERSKNKLDTALKTSSSLEATKAVYRLLGEGVAPQELVARTADLGIRFQSQFSAGLVTLAALGRVIGAYGVELGREEQTLALVQAMSPVAAETQGTAPRRFRAALPQARVAQARLEQWFSSFLVDRETFAAERTLRTAFASDIAQRDLVGMVVAGATDHVFTGTGHVLDFTNKACELLDIIGWERAPDVLTALIPDLAGATRHEEDLSWKHPKNLIAAIADADRELDGVSLEATSATPDIWEWGEALTESEPDAAIAGLVSRLRQGAGLRAASLALLAGATLRMHRFHTRNEFFDWDTVHHLFTHANALARLCARFPSRALVRALLHCYGYLHLTRFLNIPAARLPDEGGRPPSSATPDDLASAIEARRIDDAAMIVHVALRAGASTEMRRALVLAALREDLGFHTWQQLEASLSAFELLPDDARRGRALSSLARWLAAHCPTPRSLHQTVDNAIRLERGDRLYEE